MYNVEYKINRRPWMMTVILRKTKVFVCVAFFKKVVTIQNKMALLKVVKFRSLSKTLTAMEFNQFTADFIKTCGRDALLTALCDKFTNQNNSDQNATTADTQRLDTAINIVHNIIRCRKQMNGKSNKLKLEVLPTAIIGEIASYLPLKDYASLNKTNRLTYIGCNESNTLRYLDLLKLIDYGQIDLTKYIQLNHLKLKLTNFNELSLPTDGSKILPRLTGLTLDADRHTDIDLNHLKSQTAINLSNVSCLKLRAFGQRIRSKWFSFNTFRSLILSFPNIQYLILNFTNPDFSNNISEFDVNALLPNLKGLAHYNGSWRLFNHIITFAASSLKSLIFRYCERIIIPSNLVFSNLEELCITSPTIEVLNNIVNKTKSLKRIELYNLPTFINDKLQIKGLIKGLLTAHS